MDFCYLWFKQLFKRQGQNGIAMFKRLWREYGVVNTVHRSLDVFLFAKCIVKIQKGIKKSNLKKNY